MFYIPPIANGAMDGARGAHDGTVEKTPTDVRLRPAQMIVAQGLRPKYQSSAIRVAIGCCDCSTAGNTFAQRSLCLRFDVWCSDPCLSRKTSKRYSNEKQRQSKSRSF